jgi:hypothetical protein
MGRISRMDFFEFGFFVKISYLQKLRKIALGAFWGIFGVFWVIFWFFGII